MNNQFMSMAQRLSSMLAKARPGGLSVSDLVEDFLPEVVENDLLDAGWMRDPVPIFDGKAGFPDFDGSGHLPELPPHRFPGVLGLVNFLPSDDGAYCCSTLIVVSLSGSNAKGSGHLKFGDALERIIRHSQGACSGITQNIVLMTDSWVAKDYQKWFSNLEKIKEGTSVFEAYLSGEAGRVSPVDF